jgi:hypothetical protein
MLRFIFVVVSLVLFSVVDAETIQQQGNIVHTTSILSEARYLLAATSSG